jgi:Transposase DDE domain
MSKLRKSPLRVAREALTTGHKRLRLYANRFSPQTYTQPQLFACLVLKMFFKTDYRGITEIIEEFSDLRQVLGLKYVPHFTTLQKASRRLLRVDRAKRLFSNTVHRFMRRRRRRRVRRGAMDSTGLECGQRSLYYIRRRNGTLKRWQRVAYSRYAKLEASFDCDSHLLLGVLVSRGPSVDVNRFVPLLNATLENVQLGSMLADAGYDSEPNHRYARDRCGIKSYIPATLGRPSKKPPTGRYRRQMKQRLNKTYGHYGQRWQAETGFSMIKRRISSIVRGHGYWSQCRELMLLAITYNIMLLGAAVGFLQSSPDTFDFPQRRGVPLACFQQCDFTSTVPSMT